MNPVLRITDGTTIVNLFENATKGAGFFLLDWTPQASPLQDEGVWNQSPFGEGRQLVAYQFANTSEALLLGCNGADQNAVIRDTQKLRRLLLKALAYWASEWTSEPVWIEARGRSESNLRYGLLKGFSAPGDDNPFQPPFADGQPVALEDFELNLEHAPWQGTAPGTGTCAEISGLASSGESSTNAYPVDNTDDCWVSEPATIYLNDVYLGAGDFAGVSFHTGLRFQGVTIPPGATILKAEIRLKTVTNLSGNCYLRVYGEANATPATFSTYANFAARTLTSAFASWSPPAQTNGGTLTTPDLVSIVQEIVNLGGWANGNDMAFFIRNNGSDANARRQFASLENPTLAEAQLYVVYSLDSTQGQAATCEEKVYLANKQTKSYLSHLYYYDASLASFSGNLIGGAWPANVLPATPAAGDILYLICATSLTDSGPFNSAVWNVSTIQNDLTEVIYEYWDGAAWSSFIAIQDNTGRDIGGGLVIPFSLLGVGSWHWDQPSDWATTTVNGITGYVFRMRVVSVGAAPSAPQQDTRDPYTITWGYVELAAAAVQGDLPALARLEFLNEAEIGAAVPAAYERMLMGIRSVSRGVNFSAYLNAADEQNPEGLTVSAVNTAAFANDSTTPTGRRISVTIGASITSYARFAFTGNLIQQYYGRFRVFCFAQQVGGTAGDLYLRLAQTTLSPSLLNTRYSPTVYGAFKDTVEVFDFGQIVIPFTNALNQSEVVDTLRIEVQAGASSAVTIHIYQLFLLPIDEVACEAINNNGDEVVQGWYLTMDSLTRPKNPVRTFVYDQADDHVLFAMQPIITGRVLLQANAQQRVWCMGTRLNSGRDYVSGFNIANSMKITYSPRYASMRGNQ